MPEHLTRDSLPDFLKRDWIAPDGDWRIEIWPKHTGNDNATVSRFAALPVLLGVGVAFKIYYVTAWRRGESNFLESVLTRAVFYSTLLTATAFGSLWLSNQPGISSMGKLLALSLVCTLAAAALFQPALMGEPRSAVNHSNKIMPT